MTEALPASFRLDPAARRLALDPREPAFVRHPYTAYAAIQTATAAAGIELVYWEQLGCWCLFGQTAIDRLLRDRRFGREVLHVTTREALGWPPPAPHTRDFDAVDAHSLLEREPPVHTRLRGLINRAFVPRRVEALRPDIETLAATLIDAFPAGPFDLLEHYAAPLPVRVIARLLGVPETYAPRLLAWSHRMVAMYGVGRTRDVEIEANEAAAAFADFVRTLVAERRRTPGDDLLSVLIAAEAAGDRLSEAELVSTVILLLNAGHEATVHAIGHAVQLLLTAPPACRALLHTEAGAARVVEEALRLRPPLHLFKRYVLTPLDLDGVPLQVGDQVAVLLGAAGVDARRVACPMTFDPSRPEAPHASFGAGIHYCVGAPLARLELLVALQQLFARCPDLTLVEAPQCRDSWHFHGLDRLMVQCRA